MERAADAVFFVFVFVYAEGPEVLPSAHGPGTSPIGSATTRDANVNVPSAAVHMYIPYLPKSLRVAALTWIIPDTCVSGMTRIETQKREAWHNQQPQNSASRRGHLSPMDYPGARR